MKPKSPPSISPTTVERRTVLRWLGNATVLAIGGSTLSACFGRSLASSLSSDGVDAGWKPELPAEIPVVPALGFQPGSGEGDIFTHWKVNTVDTQNLADILASWTLAIDGLVTNPIVLGFADVLALERQDQVTDFHCVEGWSVYDVPWIGVPLSRLLDLAGADATATYLTFHSFG